MQRNDYRGLEEIPRELLDEIIKNIDSIEALINLIQTSKFFSAYVSKYVKDHRTLTDPRFLSHPNSLLALIFLLPPPAVAELIPNHLSPGSDNYNVIEHFAKEGDDAATLCYAFITKSIKNLDFKIINTIISKPDFFLKKYPEWEGLSESLDIMARMTTFPEESFANILRDRKKLAYLNLSGFVFTFDINFNNLNLSYINFSFANFQATVWPNFNGSILTGACFQHAILTADATYTWGGQYIGTVLKDVDFRVTTSEKQRYPSHLNLESTHLDGIKLVPDDALINPKQMEAYLNSRLVEEQLTKRLNKNPVPYIVGRLKLQEAILMDILKRCKNREVLQAAASNPYFSEFRHTLHPLKLFNFLSSSLLTTPLLAMTSQQNRINARIRELFPTKEKTETEKKALT